jgi:shikimate kinase
MRNTHAPKNLIITGFMGTGKSPIGQLVATERGHDFIDMVGKNILQ